MVGWICKKQLTEFSSTNVEVEMAKNYINLSDADFLEKSIETLNGLIDRIPTEHRVRFLPCEHCGQIFMEINFEGEIPITKHESKCAPDTFQMAYIETGKVIEWKTEDIEYAQTCEREKCLSRGY